MSRDQPRDVRTGRFRSAGSGRVTVRQPDGSAKTYRIDRDARTGELVQRLQHAAATREDADADGGEDQPSG